MPKKFVFKSNYQIGSAAAESDYYYLSQCFVDTGDLWIIRNCKDPRNILVGRTGAGKSALISHLADIEDHFIQIKPESLSLNYISNSNILRFFVEAGVKMDIFYKLLWRHVICVEVLKERYQIENEERKKNFLDSLWNLVPKKKQHQMALDYLRDWGDSFWKETEHRIQEVTTKLEKELTGSISGKLPYVGSLNGTAAKRLTEEQKEEVVHRAQEVVNKVQIRELSSVIDLIDEVLLNDRKQRYYVAIDKLDDDWVEDNLRFRLIRGLIETSLDFSRIENLKVIVAIRNDLLERVFRYTRDSGFQEEKYKSSILDLSWRREFLIEVLDKRIGVLVKDEYTKTEVTHKELLPKKVGRQRTIDYFIDRTLMRPRDIIQFFNTCIKQSDEKATIPLDALRKAEGAYSRDRLRALFDEWFSIYPNLDTLFPLLKGRGSLFLLSDLSLDDLESNFLQLLISGKGRLGVDLDLMKTTFDCQMEIEEYRKELILLFYKVGLVGLKIDPSTSIAWSHIGNPSVSISEICDTTKIQIHKTFWRVLGVYEKDEIEDDNIS